MEVAPSLRTGAFGYRASMTRKTSTSPTRLRALSKISSPHYVIRTPSFDTLPLKAWHAYQNAFQQTSQNKC